MSEIIIQLDGGLVQEVFIRGKGIPTKAIVVDEDVEGTDDYTSINIGKSKIPYEACIHTERIARLKKGCDVDLIVKEYLKK